MKKIIPISLIFMGIATFGFSQDTAKAVIETPAIEEIAEPLEIIIEPAILENEPILINTGEEAADTAGIEEMPGIIEEIEEEILLSPDVEKKVAPVETISEENIQKEAGEKIADDTASETDEDKEKPKKEKIDVVDMVYKIAGTALVIGAFIVFPF